MKYGFPPKTRGNDRVDPPDEWLLKTNLYIWKLITFAGFYNRVDDWKKNNHVTIHSQN
jgi:hypothetical protein